MMDCFITQNGDIKVLENVRELPAEITSDKTWAWLDLFQPTEQELQMLQGPFAIHPISVEDCRKENHYPKLDDFGEYIFLVVHAVDVTQQTAFATTELDIYLSKRVVITFRNKPVRSIDYLKERLRKNPDLLSKGVETLIYQLLSHMVDNYMPILEKFSERIEDLEDLIFNYTQQECLEEIFALRKDILALRRIMGPQRDTISLLSRGDYTVIRKKSQIYFRDIYDHLFRIYEMAETYRDLVAGALEVYASVSSSRMTEVSLRMNQVIKTLTVVTVLMMPTLLISSIYGMNFDMLPGLHSRLGHWVAMASMIGGTLLMWWFVKRKKWG